ncbi:MAG: glycosyltransferase family 2 protein [Proteobacteria bacterium]|nr:glycosyltransferase family 2 protein [Pseudomonadota bacterium]
MSAEPLVSVIITTYKRQPEILLRAVHSVLTQTYRNLELYIVNDYPEDSDLSQALQTALNSLQDARVHYIQHEKNCGACKARNTGIFSSSGEFVAFLDDDDEWMERKLEKQLALFTAESVGAVSCDYCTFKKANSRNTPRLTRTGTRTGTKKSSLALALLWKNCVGGCSEPLIRRSVLEELGGFDESLPASQDYDMWMRIAQISVVKFIHEPLVIHYYGDDSITGNYNKKIKGFNIFQDKYSNLYENNPDALNFRYANKVSLALANHHYSDAVSFLKKALQVKLISKYNIIEPLKGIIKLIKS